MTTTNQQFEAVPTGSMPISMAVDSNDTKQLAANEAAPGAAAKTPTKPGQKKDRAYFSRAIQAATITLYRSSKAVADLLLDARLSLSPEEFKKFINEDCQFDSSLVYKFIKMAADYTLNDPANEAILPEAWNSRYEIMLMKESTFRIGVTKGIIHADCKLTDLRNFREQIEGKKGKKASAKSSTNSKGKTAAKAKGTPKPESASGEPTEKKPSPESTPRTAPKETASIPPLPKKAAAMAGTTTDKNSRIVVVLSQEVVQRNKAEVDALKSDLHQLLAKYPFLGGIDIQENAIGLAA